MSFTSSSACSWIGHTVSGLWHATLRPFQTRSRFGSVTESLSLAAYYNSPDHSTKGTRSHLNVLSLLVGTRFQVLFHSPPGVLFTFPSQYCCAIGHQVVFRLGWWSTHVPTGFLVSRGTQDSRSHLLVFSYGAVTLYGRPSHAVLLTSGAKCRSLPRGSMTLGLASSAFARHY
jgi:hypothetical protein